MIKDLKNSRDLKKIERCYIKTKVNALVKKLLRN